MIEIIGTDQSKILQVSCRSCASILRYTPSDTERGCSTDYTGDSEYYRYIVCPKCREKVIVK